MIITLCGSNRFEKHFKAWNKALTLSGHCVFSISTYASDEGDITWYSDQQKEVLDGVHKNKIFNSHAVLILNRFSYMGPSTLSELAYAKELGKEIYVLESWGKDKGPLPGTHLKELITEKISYDIDKNYVSPIDTTNFHVWATDLLSLHTRSKLLEMVKV